MEQPFEPGGKFSADALNRSLMRQRQNQGQMGNIHREISTIHSCIGDLQLAPNPIMKLAQITAVIQFGSGSGGGSGSNPRKCSGFAYAWLPVELDKCGKSFNPDSVDGGTEDYQTAFEANQNPSVPINTVVLLYEAANTVTNDREWIFWWGLAGGSGSIGSQGTTGFTRIKVVTNTCPAGGTPVGSLGG